VATLSSGEAAAAVATAAQTAAARTVLTATAISTEMAEPGFPATHQVPLPPGAVLAQAAATKEARVTAAAARAAVDCGGGGSDGNGDSGGGCRSRKRRAHARPGPPLLPPTPGHTRQWPLLPPPSASSKIVGETPSPLMTRSPRYEPGEGSRAPTQCP